MSASFRHFFAVVGLSVATAAVPDVARADALDDYNTAVTLYQQQRWELAAELAGQFLESYPDHEKAALATLYLGQSRAKLRDYDAARRAFRVFVRRFPQHRQIDFARYRVGEASYFLNDFEAASRELTAYLASNPQDDLVDWGQLYLGESFVELKRPAEAENVLRAVLKKRPTGRISDDARLALARALTGRGKTDEAAAEFRRLAADADQPRADEAQYELASLLFRAGRHAAARDAFDDVAKRFPDSRLKAQAMLNAGFAAFRLGKFEEARDRFDLSAADADRRTIASYWSAVSRKKSGDLSGAAAAFRSQLDTTNDAEFRSKIRYQLGDALSLAGETAAALREFETLSEEQPNSPLADDALHAATDAALRLNQFEKAERLNREFDRRHGESPLARRQKLLAARLIVLKLGDDPDPDATGPAVQMLRPLIDEQGLTGGAARVQLARLLELRGESRDAEAVLGPLLKGVEVDSGLRAEARALAASLAFAAGRLKDAERLAKLVPDGPLAGERQVVLSRAAAARGDWSSAETAIQALPASFDSLTRDATYKELAEAAYAAKNWQQAARWFGEAIDSKDAGLATSATSGRAFSLYELGQYADAVTEFKSLQEKAGDNDLLASTAVYMRGRSEQAAGRAAEAGVAFADGIRRFVGDGPGETAPVSGDAAELTWNVYRMAKGAARIAREAAQADDSDRLYEIAATQLTRLPKARQGELDRLLNEWALLAYEAERFDRSDELFRRLAEARPNSPLADDAKLYLAESDFFAGNLDKASRQFTALADSPQSDELVRARALLLNLDIAATQSRWKDQAAIASRILRDQPNGPNRGYARFRLGEAQLQTGDNLAAAKTFGAALADREAMAAAEEWSGSVWVMLAESLVRQRKYSEAEAVAKDFGAAKPDSPLSYQMDEVIGRSLKNRALFPEARERLERVTASETGRRTETAAKAQLLIAETFYLEERWPEAVKSYFKVYANYDFPEFQAPALLQAASADEQQGQREAAARTYELILKEFPGSDAADAAKVRLGE